MGMAPDHHDGELHHTGDDRTPSRAHHTQGREGADAEDEEPVKERIGADRHDAGNHGGHRLSRLAEGISVDLGQGHGHKGNEGDLQVLPTVVQGQGYVARGVLVVEEQGDQVFSEGNENGPTNRQDHEGSVELEAYRVAQTFVVPLAEELGGEDARPRKPAKQTEGKDEYELVGDTYARKLFGTQAADHNIIQ